MLHSSQATKNMLVAPPKMNACADRERAGSGRVVSQLQLHSKFQGGTYEFPTAESGLTFKLLHPCYSEGVSADALQIGEDFG